MAIVTIRELGDGGPDLLQVAEGTAVDHLLLQRPVEALGHAVGLRLGNEGEAGRDASELDLAEEVIGRVLRAIAQ